MTAPMAVTASFLGLASTHALLHWPQSGSLSTCHLRNIVALHLDTRPNCGPNCVNRAIRRQRR